jgi:transposase
MTRRLELNEVERTTLVQAVKHHPKAYARERAAALVKVAAGASAHQVAREGLLTRHAPDTVYRWLDRYEAVGIAGLLIRPGRGRKPRLSPPGECRAGRAGRRLAAAARG